MIGSFSAHRQVLWPLAFLVSIPAMAQEVPGCGTLLNANGPWDYTNAQHVAERLPIVERHHFRIDTQRLQVDSLDGKSPGDDMDYTLRAFPNHHKALYTMSMLELTTKQSPPMNASYTADCYFKRAIAFRPQDGTVRMIYAGFLHKTGHLQAALEQYDAASQMMSESPELQYNLGLLHFDLGNFDESLEYAHLAYAAGFPLPGLKKRLSTSGHWREPAKSTGPSSATVAP